MKRTAFFLLISIMLLSGCLPRNANTPPENILSIEQAQSIVFERAGVTKDKVTELETKLEYDDEWRVWEYDIEFTVGGIEYESEVNAVTGTVLKFYF